MISDSFIFYRSFYEAVKKIPKGEREELYEAIFEYALNGECYTGDNGVAGMVLEFVRPQIDANIQRRMNGMKGAEAGKKGGRPKKPQENPTETPNVNDNVECKCLNDLKENISINRDKKENEPKFNFKKSLLDLGVPPEYVDEWLLIRKSKKAVNTEMALKVLTDEANKAGIMVADAVRMCCENQWRGFKAEYYANLIRSMARREDTGGGGRLRSTEEMQKIVECGRKLYEQSLNYK